MERASATNEKQCSPAAIGDKVKAPHEKIGETMLCDSFPIQLKLSVGSANDPLEHEADAMADEVMRMPETSFMQQRTTADHTAAQHADGALRLKPLTGQITPFIQRQQTPAPVTPGFSVNQTAYLGLVNSALGQMSGNLVNSETLAPVVLPILQAMLASVSWKDTAGNITGGGIAHYTTPTGITLNLRMILTDGPNALLAGEFTHRGATDGEMEVFIQNNPDADRLAETIYHEAMHIVAWLINRTPPALTLRSTARGPGQAGGAGTLDQSHWAQALHTIHIWLDALAGSVNTRRPASARISPADLDHVTSWLYDEISVRIETEVFRLVSSTQQALHSRGPSVIMGTGTNWQINSTMLNHYIFDLSRVFLPGDKAGLTSNDQQTLNTLEQILEGLFQGRVARRFNPNPYFVGRSIPRAPFQFSPAPLVPPRSFGPTLVP